MICPECNGKGEAIYFVETYRDENTVTVEKRNLSVPFAEVMSAGAELIMDMLTLAVIGVG